VLDGSGPGTASQQQPGTGTPILDPPDRILTIVRDMDSSIRELEILLAESARAVEANGSPAGSLSMKRSTAQLRSRKEKEEKETLNGKSEHGIFGIFHRRSSSLRLTSCCGFT